jgi:hypothetical protein
MAAIDRCLSIPLHLLLTRNLLFVRDRISDTFLNDDASKLSLALAGAWKLQHSLLLMPRIQSISKRHLGTRAVVVLDTGSSLKEMFEKYKQVSSDHQNFMTIQRSSGTTSVSVCVFTCFAGDKL